MGLSAPFNAWMTFFGQFFDHGLDLVAKGGSGTVFIPLQPDDPLYVPGSPTNFMVLTRATNQPGADGILGTADDVHEHTNTTSPFVDQNQTYSSHPSHQVFLREYAARRRRQAGGDRRADREPRGRRRRRVLHRRRRPDRRHGDLGGRQGPGARNSSASSSPTPTSATCRCSRRTTTACSCAAPNGFAAGRDASRRHDSCWKAIPQAPISLANAVRTGHAFLDDIAHNAAPVKLFGSRWSTRAGRHRRADPHQAAPTATIAGNAVAVDPAGAELDYDDELLDAHYIAGDGRVNENIGLTAVHHVFHAEHNRAGRAHQARGAAPTDATFLNEWLHRPVAEAAGDRPLQWNGERLFQAAKFGTEMQYQHLVFEEFARTIQPQVDIFFAATQVYDTELNPSIVAEFAHTVYRFGHSMLTETIDRLDPNFASSEIGLIEAFLNPLAFAASGPTPDEAAGAIVRGVTRQVGNEIDEFVTEALRNNLLGLPLDLAAINIARGRDTGIPSLNAARREFFEVTGDTNLKPYDELGRLRRAPEAPGVARQLHRRLRHARHDPRRDHAGREARGRDAARVRRRRRARGPARLPEFSTGDWVRRADGTTTTGLDNVDLWIGGLAEEKMPFGGMLGSTFNFVFEEQLEKLQDGDRFYYLDRTAGLNFLSQLENNSFAKLIMANTDTKHLPALVFTAPGMILEVDQTQQFTGLGDGRQSRSGRRQPAHAAGDSRGDSLSALHRRRARGHGRNRRERHHHLQRRRRHALGRRRRRPPRRRLRQRQHRGRRRQRHHHRHRRRRRAQGQRRPRRDQRRQRHQPGDRRPRQRLHPAQQGRRRGLRRAGQRLHHRRQRHRGHASATKATTGSSSAPPTAAWATTSTRTAPTR